MDQTDPAVVTEDELPLPRRLLDLAVAVLLVAGIINVNGYGVSATGFTFGASGAPTDFTRLNGILTEDSLLRVLVTLALIVLVIFVPLPRERGPVTIAPLPTERRGTTSATR